MERNADLDGLVNLFWVGLRWAVVQKHSKVTGFLIEGWT
jgi:hypothetical protein